MDDDELSFVGNVSFFSSRLIGVFVQECVDWDGSGGCVDDISSDVVGWC